MLKETLFPNPAETKTFLSCVSTMRRSFRRLRLRRYSIEVLASHHLSQVPLSTRMPKTASSRIHQNLCSLAMSISLKKPDSAGGTRCACAQPGKSRRRCFFVTKEHSSYARMCVRCFLLPAQVRLVIFGACRDETNVSAPCQDSHRGAPLCRYPLLPSSRE